jgi:hypothetical protein
MLSSACSSLCNDLAMSSSEAMSPSSSFISTSSARSSAHTAALETKTVEQQSLDEANATVAPKDVEVVDLTGKMDTRVESNSALQQQVLAQENFLVHIIK